jgi:hypothetical protein
MIFPIVKKCALTDPGRNTHVGFPPERVEQNLRPVSRHSGEAEMAVCSLRSAAVPTGAAHRLVAVPQIFVRPD